MALRLSLTPRAAGDLAGIRDCLVVRNPQGADNVQTAIDRKLLLLAEHRKFKSFRKSADMVPLRPTWISETSPSGSVSMRTPMKHSRA